MHDIEVHMPIELDRPRRGAPLPPIIVEMKPGNRQESDPLRWNAEIDSLEMNPLRLGSPLDSRNSAGILSLLVSTQTS
jgi:hypothetical protein